MSINVLRVPPTIWFGEDAAKRAGAEAKRFKALKVLIITDAYMVSSGTINGVIDSLKEEGLQYDIYSGVDQEPTLAHVDECLALLKKTGGDLLIACGGGSPIDVAKAVSAMAVNPGKIQDYMGADKFTADCLPVIAVPTTAGTGSEATAVTIITDTERDVKMLISSPRIMPRVALVDPLLTLKMPKGLTAATGLDALTHAIEAYVSRKAQPMTDILALSAVKLISKYLPIAWAEPDNLEARTKTMLGALQAGMAFSNASVALVHGMSRPVGALFHVPHGVSNACLLGEVMDFSLSGNYERYAEVARAMGLPDLADDVKTAESGAAKVRSIIKKLQVPTLTELGVSRDKLAPVVEKMAEDAIASGSPGNNPRLAAKEEIIQLYYAAL
ncbi:MAG: iron-containing alcohol dehydrogenase [Deltaproteobacteria bacterium]|jgi:alcohol dehydrogenase|nr:iron-containing alcohol dehydrogenase [Deltaproteobacteria bacterium]